MLFPKEERRDARETKTTDVHCRNEAKDVIQAFPPSRVMKHLLIEQNALFTFEELSMHFRWLSSKPWEAIN